MPDGVGRLAMTVAIIVKECGFLEAKVMDQLGVEIVLKPSGRYSYTAGN